jgi:hypothetical protein
MKNFTPIKDTGRLQGQESIDRMKGMMDITPIKESVDRYNIELTKIGPDGKAYAIVKENHDYFIKIAENSDNLTRESFNYIGGLKHKMDFAYPSYAKAIKQLNLKFISLNEALGKDEPINTFSDDNLIEHHNMTPTKYGKYDPKEYIIDKKGEELKMDAKEGDEFGEGDEGTSYEEEVTLTETERKIEKLMDLFNEESDYIVSENDIKFKRPALSISKAVGLMPEFVAEATGDKLIEKKETVKQILSELSENEIAEILGSLKKKV